MSAMQYTRLGNSGLIVSRLAFGAMTFGSAEGTVFAAISKVDQKLATELGDALWLRAENCAEHCGSEAYLEPTLIDRRGNCRLLRPDAR